MGLVITRNTFSQILSSIEFGENRVDTYLKRSRVDWETGRQREPFIELPGRLIVDGEISSLLLTANRARMNVRTPDGGTVYFEFPSRTYIVHFPTEQADALVGSIQSLYQEGEARIYKLLRQIATLGCWLFLAGAMILALTPSGDPSLPNVFGFCSVGTDSRLCKSSQPETGQLLAGFLLASVILAACPVIIAAVIHIATRPWHFLPDAGLVRSNAISAGANVRRQLSISNLTGNSGRFLKHAGSLILAAAIGAIIVKLIGK